MKLCYIAKIYLFINIGEAITMKISFLIPLIKLSKHIVTPTMSIRLMLKIGVLNDKSYKVQDFNTELQKLLKITLKY